MNILDKLRQNAEQNLIDIEKAREAGRKTLVAENRRAYFAGTGFGNGTVFSMKFISSASSVTNRFRGIRTQRPAAPPST
ncbi:hypothetical protein DENIS_3731 [Desulfonema ishimotonii]|uniref:Uncharacterized protein n=1 Tax=Desulfonema ishimotonii TaxID=45657 RepID=A0A401G0K7_9BACT|nr:hypothetical protein DENIS_3731 [Desulfonema ishimotonii]